MKYASQTVKVYGASLVQTWSDCPRCFWRRYIFDERRPNSFGDTFDIADKAMRECFARPNDEGWINVGVGPDRMRMHSQGVWVESEPISFPDLRISIMLAGRYDAIVEDESNCRYLIDYKTSARDESELYPYRRQLDAYRFCLEHPNPDDHRLQPAMDIDEIGLLIYTPRSFAFKNRSSGLYGPTRWLDFARDDSAFMRFLKDVATLLSHDEPENTGDCEWCAYRAIGDRRSA